MEFLKGKKTYIVAALAGLATALHYAGLLETSTLNTVLGFLGAGGLATLRAGVSSKE